MRIILIHQYYLEKDDPGGSRFNEITKIWAENGHKIDVLAGMVNYTTGLKPKKYKGKILHTEKYHENIKVVRCHVSEAYNKNFLGRFWAYWSFVFSSLYGSIRFIKGKHDIIIATSPPLFVGISAYLIGLSRRIPLIFEVRDLWPESAIDTGVLRNKLIIKLAYWFEKFIYKKSKVINTLTPTFKKHLIERKNVPKEKLIMIPNAADFSIVNNSLTNFNREEFRKERNWEDKLVVIYVGAHGIANHLIQVIETAEILKNTNIHFVLVGDGMQKPELIKETNLRKLKNVEFISPQSKTNIFKFIKASDIGASVLKKNDTFKTVYSNKTFDYMACKIPVLMVIDGISRQLIEKAQAGIFIEPENPQDFAEKIMIYHDNAEFRQKHGNNGYNYALNNFDRKSLAEKYLNQINSIIVHV
jgi:glycosyltransferase involved in cell wall biosynthesis